MSATLDANVLLYASDETSPLRPRAIELLRSLAGGREIVYLFWPVVFAYLRIATHPGVFESPLEPARAVENVESLLRRPHVRSPGEGERFWEAFLATATQTPVRGNLVPDAHMVALMRESGVRTIWTRDRDFRLFDGVVARDPF